MPQLRLHTRIVLLVTVIFFAMQGESSSAESRVGCRSETSSGPAGILITDLRCERRRDPIAVDTLAPRLSWVLVSDQRGRRQSAYRVLVAGSRETLAQDSGDLWDSGKVASSETLNVTYAGRPLTSGQACFWKVRVWDESDRATEWSQAGAWEVALLDRGDWGAFWLNDGKTNPPTDATFFNPDPAPVFRKEFTLSKPLRRARLHITGLGYYEASLNGVRVGDHVLDPGWTAVDRRVLYSTYDVTDAVRPGANCLGVMVGNGWYNPLPLRLWGHLNLREHLATGRPRFIARLTLDYADGTSFAIVSDPSWKWSEGAIRFNNIYLGEIYDARREVPGWDQAGFDDSAWQAPAVASEPVGPLLAQAQPPIRVTEHVPSVRTTEPRPGILIFDLGQNLSGWASVRFEGAWPPGASITLRYGELLHQDGTLNPMTSVAGQIKGTRKNAQGIDESIGGPGAPPIAWQRDVYITRGVPDSSGGETYTPRFTFHGFRYVEITGLPEGTDPGRITVTGLRLNSDVADAGSFSCSNELLNRIQQMCRRTFLANILGVQSDCPHRERFGYGGDIVASSEAYSLNFDMSGFYAKSVRDFADAARPDGLLTDTAPFVGIQYCGVGWAMAHPLLVTQLGREYSDDRPLAEQYDTARRWLLEFAEDQPGGLVAEGLGDHEALEQTPVPQVGTPLYVRSAEILAGMARTLGKQQDAARFDSLAETGRGAYRKAFPGLDTLRTQASLAFALGANLVADQDRAVALSALIDRIRVENQGRLTTGILGTKYMLDQLSREGRADVAYSIVNQRDFPGWGWMLENGATTLWEHWALSDNTYSHSHPMFGSVSQWMFNWLGGIQPAPDARGYDSILIRPQPVGGLDWVRTSHRTVRGDIVSNWRREEQRLVLEVDIPIGAVALVYVPATRAEDITENGQPLTAPGRADIEVVRIEPARAGVPAEEIDLAAGRVVCRVGSGSYHFVVDRER